MKKFAPLVILLLLGCFYWFKSSQTKTDPSQNPEETEISENIEESKPSVPKAEQEAIGAVEDDLSAQFMVDYGKEELSPEKDLTRVSEMLESYFLLVKSSNPLPMGENRDVAAALMGGNPYRTRLLSPDSPWLNAQSELTDRWNTPLYFHAISAKKVGVRSAGPDQKMWTPDDLVDGENALPLSK